MRNNQFDTTRYSRGIRSMALAACIMVSASMMACGGNSASSTADYIGINAAKEAALKAAELSSSEVEFLAAGLDSKNGTFYYQVIFTEHEIEHEYDIDALTGVVIEESHSPQSDAAAVNSGQTAQVLAAGESEGAEERRGPEGTEAAQSAGGKGRTASGEGSTSGSGASEKIDADAVFLLALSHAGLTEEDIRFSHVKADKDDGRSIYDVEFITSDGTEYDYELSAEDGSIISYELDAESLFRQRPSADSSIISESQARQAVLDRIPGVKEENVQVKLEEDDGRMEYKGKLIYDHMEYKYKIDAYSGGLIEWEAELIGR